MRLTQDKTGVALDTWKDLWLLNSPSSNIREDLVSHRSLFGSSGNSPSRLRNLLLELLNERRLDACGLKLAAVPGKLNKSGQREVDEARIVEETTETLSSDFVDTPGNARYPSASQTTPRLTGQSFQHTQARKLKEGGGKGNTFTTTYLESDLGAH